MPTAEEYLKMKRKQLLGGRMKPPQEDSYYRPYAQTQKPTPQPGYRESARFPRIRPDQAYAAYQPQTQQPQRRPLDVPEQTRGMTFPSQTTTAQMQPQVQAHAAGQEPEDERLKRLLQMTRYGNYAY